MNNKIRLATIIFLLVASFAANFFLSGEPYFVQAGALRSGLDLTADQSGLKSATVTDVPSLIGAVISVVLQFLSLAFLIIIVYAGIRWMTANGDPGKVKEARGWMMNGAIGLFMALMAYQVVGYIIDHIQITGAEPTPAPPEPPATP